MSVLQELSTVLQRGRLPKVKELVEQAISEGIAPNDILEDGLLKGMAVIGEKFKKNEVFIPEVMMAARAMNAGVELLRPLLISAGTSTKGTAVIGTVKGDLHDIGKNICKMMLEAKGLEVFDLGTDVTAETFVQKAIEHNASVICCSALLTTTMNEMKNVIIKATEDGIRDKVTIMIGGAPVTQEFCDSIMADYYTPDAATCSEIALQSCLTH
ncbi:MAG: corrinoid protein [Clostridia bacterium]|nr:corrinoid protein [Clostridia bacterium]